MFNYMGVLLASLQFLGRPEEGTSFPGTRVSGSCEVLSVGLISDPALHLPASSFCKINNNDDDDKLSWWLFLVCPCAVPTSLFSNTQEVEGCHTFSSSLSYIVNHGFLVRTISMEIIVIFTYFEIFCAEDEIQGLVYVSKHSTNEFYPQP